tara:strand:+ start:457 stop:603 length:147 start_codon:yes stop_codon:yes gene_type:complete
MGFVKVFNLLAGGLAIWIYIHHLVQMEYGIRSLLSSFKGIRLLNILII